MAELKTTRLILVMGIGLFACCLAKAQSTLHCLEKGSWIPVYEVRGKTPYCFTGDGLMKGDPDQLTMLPAREFSPGFLNVEILENKRKGVVQLQDTLRFVSKTGWFQFTAKVTATEDIEDCYFAMRFDALGESSFYCKPIGRLEAGKSKHITILTQLAFEMPKQLHFYSGMKEIRTNLVPSEYRYEYGEFQLASN